MTLCHKVTGDKMGNMKLGNIKSKKHLKTSIEYIFNPEKTDGGRYIFGDSGTTAEEVEDAFLSTKDVFGKNDGRQAYHFILTFGSDESVTEALAQKITEKFMEQYFPADDHDWTAAVHNDKEHMHLFVAAGYPVIKEEMIIASLIDGIDDDYIKGEIISDDDIDSIKRKRADYLMENFRSRDAEYNQLQEELIILQAQMKDVDKVIGRQKEEYVSLSKEIEAKKEENRRLTEELNSRGSEDGYTYTGARKETETRTVTKYKRPEGFKETIYCLLGKTDKMPEQIEETISDRQEFFNIVIDSDLSTEQIKEIEQAYKDGIEIKLIKKIANKEFTPERMRALRRMVCILNSKKYSETDSAAAGLTADEERMAYERAVDDCMVITDESVKGYEADLQHMISLPVTQTKPAEEKQN